MQCRCCGEMFCKLEEACREQNRRKRKLTTPTEPKEREAFDVEKARLVVSSFSVQDCRRYLAMACDEIERLRAKVNDTAKNGADMLVHAMDNHAKLCPFIAERDVARAALALTMEQGGEKKEP